MAYFNCGAVASMACERIYSSLSTRQRIVKEYIRPTDKSPYYTSNNTHLERVDIKGRAHLKNLPALQSVKSFSSDEKITAKIKSSDNKVLIIMKNSMIREWQSVTTE